MSKKKSTDTQPKVLTLEYRLAELPSSQHRAGLAGLVMMIRWLERQGIPEEAICTLESLDEDFVRVVLSQAGVRMLFDEAYAAAREEQPFPALRTKGKGDDKQIVPPLEEREVEKTDPKTGKTKLQKMYVYPVVVPRGSFLMDLDPTYQDEQGDWIKLWRDMLWNVPRGVPTTRNPYEKRSEGTFTEDADKAWTELLQPSEFPVDLPSTYYLGAQANNAENVPFKDRARYQFLLHFWPFTAQIYVPAVLDGDGNREFKGYALAIPDVGQLESFCDELPVVLRNRGQERSGYRPRDAVVSLAAEGALDIYQRLKERLIVREGALRTSDLLLGVDVLHLEKQGNNVRLLSSTRLEPEDRMVDEYAVLRKVLWNPLFARQRLINLVNNRPWYAGFDSLLSTTSDKLTIRSDTFRHDARNAFQHEGIMTESTILDPEPTGVPTSTPGHESLVYRLVSIYLSRKLQGKYDLTWEKCKGNPSREKEYREKKEKLAREAFLALRGRTDSDFVQYFVSTLCSVPQALGEPAFVSLARALDRETDKIRTLTMLALSAQSPYTTNQKGESNGQ